MWYLQQPTSKKKGKRETSQAEIFVFVCDFSDDDCEYDLGYNTKFVASPSPSPISRQKKKST